MSLYVALMLQRSAVANIETVSGEVVDLTCALKREGRVGMLPVYESLEALKKQHPDAAWVEIERVEEEGDE